jgi:hypothetical protein
MNTLKKCKLPKCGTQTNTISGYCDEHGKRPPKGAVTGDHEWLARKVTQWSRGKEFLVRSGAVEHGYYFANDTSSPMCSVMTRRDWLTLRVELDLIPAFETSNNQVSKMCESHGDKPKYNIEEFQQNRNTKYDREIIGLCGTKVMVDVYRVQDAFPANSPMVDHVNKKSLANGSRGHKSMLEDLIDMRNSINAAIVLHLQKYGEK